MEILHIITWGTIDSYYDVTKDTVVPSLHSAIPAYIESMKPYLGYETVELCMKDSRSITQEDRHKMKELIESSPQKYILITHGTYTMPDTARYLEEKLGKFDKVIILTGSMIPLQWFSPSDAGFNLGFAIACFLSAPPGVYVAMNARLFSPEEVVKTLEEGRFSSISDT